MKIRELLLCGINDPVDLTQQPMQQPVAAGGAVPPVMSREEKVARYKAIVAKIKPFVAKEYLTPAESRAYVKLNDEAISLRFDITRPLTPDRVQADDKSTLSPEVVIATHKDMHSNKPIYMALLRAAAGASYDADTAIDNIMNGRNPEVSPSEFYHQFDGTRAALHAQYGDTVPLFRAEGKQKPKATTNWATTKAFAQQFGPRVIQRDIAIQNILAVNIGGGGRYHELIVGTPPAA